MPLGRRALQHAVAWAASHARGRPLRWLRCLNNLQLGWYVHGFAGHPDVVALVLRRPGVLVDALPGVSDFDVTCVFRAVPEALGRVAAALARRHRSLKRFAPAIGETHFVCEADYPSYRRFAMPDLTADSRPHVLWRSGDSELPANRPRGVAFRLAITELLTRFLLRDFAAPGVEERWAPGRCAEKTCRKIEFLLVEASSDADIVYPARPGPGRLDCRRPREQDRRITAVLARCAQYVSGASPGERVRLEVVVPPSPGERGLGERMRAHVEPLLDAGADVGAVWLGARRLYHSDKVVFVEIVGGLDRTRDSPWRRALRRATSELAAGFADALSPAHPVIVDSLALDAIRRGDELFAAFAALGRHDLASGRVIASGEAAVEVSRESLLAELATAVSMLPSAFRIGLTHHLLDLVLGRLLATRLMIEDRVLLGTSASLLAHCSGGLPSGRLHGEVLACYEEGDAAALDRLRVAEAWKLFEELIVHEIGRARALLDEEGHAVLR